MERLNGTLMLSSSIVYVTMSYISDREGIYESEWFQIFDRIVCCLVMFLWSVKFYVKPNKKTYLM